jgi:hypothetical protein
VEKEEDNTLSYADGDRTQVADSNGVHLAPASLDDQPGFGMPGMGGVVNRPEAERRRPVAHFLRNLSRMNVMVVVLIVLAVGLLAGLQIFRGSARHESPAIADQFTSATVPLQEIVDDGDLAVVSAATVKINGGLQLNGPLTVGPSVQPTGAKAGQLYYDEGLNQLAYFNGQGFVFLTSPQPQNGGLQSLGGATGQLALGSGLTIADGSLANDGVLSVQGQTGEVTFTAGPGLVLNGTTFSNSGVISLSTGTPNVTLNDDGKGNVTISVAGAGTGTVASSGGTAGTIPLFTTGQNIENSIITQSGLNVAIGGNLTLGSALGVDSGGTGQSFLPNNGVLIGQGGSPVSGVTAGGIGLCLLSTAGAPVFAACPSSGSSSVSSLDGLTGALTIANSSGMDTIITIDDATTSTKGIASYNAANLFVTNGVVNTIQNISASSTPTFAGLNTNNINPSAALTVGSTGQTLLLQGATTTITSTGGSNNIVLNAAGTIELQDSTNVTGNVDVSGTLTVGTANAFVVATDGTITSLGNGNLQGGSMTLGTSAQKGTLLLSDGSANTGTLQTAALGQNTVYTLPDPGGASAAFCLTTGNCAGVAGGVTTAGGTTNRLAKFSGLQAVADSTITDDGTTVTASVNMVIQGGNLTVGTAAQKGNLLLHAGNGQTATLQAGSSAGNLTFILPTATGIANQCIKQSGVANQLVFQDCDGGAGGSSATLQTAYNNSTNPELTVDASRGAVTIRDAATPIGANLLEVQSNNGSSTYFAVGASGVTAAGTINTVGGGLQTNTVTRVDNSGNLLNIGNLTASGALTISSTGAGNDIVLNAADAIFLQDATTVNGTLSLGGALALGANDISGTNLNFSGSNGNLTLGGTLSVQGGTINSSGALSITPSGTLTAGSSGNTLTLQGNASTSLRATSGGFTTTLSFVAPTATRAIILPDASGTVCLQGSASCGFMTGSGVAYVQGGNSFGAAANFGTTDNFGLNIKTNNVTVASFTNSGAATLQNATDSTTALAVKTAAGSGGLTVLSVDTSNARVGVGTAAPSAQFDVAGKVPSSSAGSVGTASIPYRVTTAGKYAYVANFASVQVFDITRQTVPVSMGSTSIASTPSDLTVSGNYAFAWISINNELDIVDVSNPATPVKVKTMTINNIDSVAVQGRYMYVATSNSNNDFLIYDITNPASPVLLSTLSQIRTNIQVVVQGRYAYIRQTGALFNSYLQIVDISNPASPVNAGGLQLGSYGSLYVLGRYAYLVGTGTATLEAVSISNAASPTSVSTFTTAGTGVDMTIQGKYAYLALDGTNQIQVVNIANPAAMTSVGTVAAGGTISSLAIQGRYVYATEKTGNTLKVFDFGGAYIQQLETGGVSTTTLDVSGSIAVAGSADFTGGLRVNHGLGVTGDIGVSGSQRLQTDSVNALQVLTTAGSEVVGVNSTDSIVRLLSNGTGRLAPFATNASFLPGQREGFGTVTVNGRVYVIGGCDISGNRTNTTYYASLNANGSVGSWASTATLPTANCNGAATAHNGYIYVVGGTSALGTSDDIYYAKPNADGTITAWQTASVALTTPLRHHSLVAYNGYLYAIGGQVAGGSDNQNIYYASINSDGSLGTMTTSATWLPAVMLSNAPIVANGYLYVVGGRNAAVNTNAIYYGRLNSDGSIAAATTTTMPIAVSSTSVAVLNGYLYTVGGSSGGSPITTVRYAALNTNGSLGTWVSNTNSLPPLDGRSSGGAASLNGYIYYFGGVGSDETDTVYYASGARVSIGGSLDLVGITGGDMSGSSTGGQLTAGNTYIAGTIEISNKATFRSDVVANGSLTLRGAVQVLSGSLPTFSIDLTSSRVYIGNPTADTTGALLVLDVKSGTGDPTGVDGGMYYNGYWGTFRCYEKALWGDCLGTPKPNSRRTAMMVANGSNDVMGGYGDVLTNTGTTGGSVGASLLPMVWYDTAATTGTLAGTSGVASYSNFQVFQSSMEFSAGTTLERVWLGLTSATQATMAASATPAGHYAAFRYDTSAGDTKLKCVTNNNTTPTIVDSGVGPTDYPTNRLEIINLTTHHVFKINGQTVCDIATTLPSSFMRVAGSVTTLSNAVRGLYIGWFYIESPGF